MSSVAAESFRAAILVSVHITISLEAEFNLVPQPARRTNIISIMKDGRSPGNNFLHEYLNELLKLSLPGRSRAVTVPPYVKAGRSIKQSAACLKWPPNVSTTLPSFDYLNYPFPRRYGLKSNV